MNRILSVDGIKISVVEAGIRKANRKDLVLFEISQGAKVAAVFTKNAFCAAPVILAKKYLAKATPRYLLINTGNANAGMGKRGLEDARKICKTLSEAVGCKEIEVLPFSTGVIGEPLPTEKIIQALPKAISGLANEPVSSNGWALAAEGIMTTDTCSKTSSKQIKLNGKLVTITGVSKGAGMIKPNMATMLAYVATDANVSRTILIKLLKEVVDTSFNRITVDGDTSTNDACVLIATGKAGHAQIKSIQQKEYVVLKKVLESVFIELAQAIIRDAEGATKFITLDVSGGKTDAECLQAAYAVAESPLVKTAFFASDANWGRIVAAIGRSGIKNLDVDKIKICLNNVLIVEKGGRAANYNEQAGKEVMRQKDITIRIQLGRGKAKQTVWTSDLSHDYVKINAEYRS